MRIEHDSLGSLEVPNYAYYGIQTERNRQAFDISDLTLEDFPSFIERSKQPAPEPIWKSVP